MLTQKTRTEEEKSKYISGEQVIQNIRVMIEDSNINNNDFYKTFRTSTLESPILKDIFQQYYYYIRTFPQILAGLSGRVESEFIRMKLSRTVVSELGDGQGDPHFIMFEKVLLDLGIELDDWREAKLTTETEELVNGLRHLFLKKPTNYALGAHYVIEEFGFPMIVNLYEGFRLYKDWKHESFSYFYLHMLIESEHVDWINAAILEAAKEPLSTSQLEDGAREVLDLLSNFWSGLNRLAMR